MKLTAYQNGEAKVEQSAIPTLASGEVLVKIKACGICGSDVPRVLSGKLYYYPIVVGHEFSGIVEDSNSVHDKKRVCIFPILPCKTCEQCQKGQYANCSNYNYYGSRTDGGMQDYLAVKEENLVFLPDNVSFAQGAMIEPVAVCLHAVKKANLQKGESVIIFGAGTIGLLCGMWAKDFGAENVYFVDIDQKKLDMAQSLGFKLYQGERVHVAIEASGAGVCFRQAVEKVSPFGRIVLVGNAGADVTVPQSTYAQILRKQLFFFGSWNSDFSSVSNDWKESVQAISEKRICPESLITHTFALEESNKAFDVIKKSEFYNKIMVVMQ